MDAITSTFDTAALARPIGPDASTPALAVESRLQPVGRWSVVTDRVTNRTLAPLPLIVAHSVKRPAGGEVRYCGRLASAALTYWGDPANPTLWADGLGLLWLDDASRVHAIAGEDRAGDLAISDRSRVLAPGETQELVWAWTQAASYWEFCDAARALLGGGVHELAGPPAWLRLHHGWSDEQIVRHAALTGCASLILPPEPLGDGDAHGLGLLAQPLATMAAEIARRRRLLPRLKQLVYFDFGHIGRAVDLAMYPEARQLDWSGCPLVYPGQGPLMLPVAGTRYAEAIAAAARTLLGTSGADGLYLDLAELGDPHRPYHYGAWDGASGDVDPGSRRLLAQKASVALLTESFRVGLIRELQASGATAVCNGAPWTRASGLLEVLRFVECGRAEDYPAAHLTTPCAYLGGAPRSQDDADGLALAARREGCLPVDPWDLDFSRTRMTVGAHLFPTTPALVRPI